MKNLILSLFATVLMLGIGVADVEAKRLGGGSSLGMQRAAPPQTPRQSPATAPAQAANPSPQQPVPATTPPKRSWMGPLAGLAAGIGLAALFSHFGMGEGLGSIVMIALLAFAALLVFRLLTRRNAATPAPSPLQYAGAHSTAAASAPVSPAASFPASAATPAGPALPADFDATAFARQAKVNFIRLQAANDAGNIDDIRDFTTPEMFAEIRLQMADRGTAVQRTDVVQLDAEVLEVAEEAQRFVASVRFHGLLREEANAPPAAFDEIWHLTKPRTGDAGWVIAGIQQVV